MPGWSHFKWWVRSDPQAGPDHCNDTWEARGIIPGKKYSWQLPLVYACCYDDLIITANLKLHNGKACFPNTCLWFLGNGHPHLSSKTSHQQAGSAAGGRSSGTQPCLCPAPRGDTAKATSAQSWLSSSVPRLTLCVRRIGISQWQHVKPRNARRLNLAPKCQTPAQPRGAQGDLRLSWIYHHDNHRDCVSSPPPFSAASFLFRHKDMISPWWFCPLINTSDGCVSLRSKGQDWRTSCFQAAPAFSSLLSQERHFNTRQDTKYRQG